MQPPDPTPIVAGLRGLLVACIAFAAVQAVYPSAADPEGVALVASLGLAAASWLGLMLVGEGDR